MKKRADGRYQEQLPLKMTGGKRVVLYGRTKAELTGKINQYKYIAEHGKPFDEVADEWWEEAEPKLAAQSVSNYRPAYRRAKEYFGKTSVKELRPAEILVFLKKQIKERSMADKTARTQLMIVNLICQYALEMGYIDMNPCAGVEVPAKLEKSERNVASKDDIGTIKNSVYLPMGFLIYFIMCTGCRRNEALALTWDDIDLDHRTIHVSKTLFRDKDGRTKTKVPKTVMGDRLVPIFDELFVFLEDIEPKKGLLFPNKEGNYITSGSFEQSFRRYKEMTGVSCIPHELRHTFATSAIESEVPIETAQAWLGHAQYSTTEKYTHIREEHRIKQIEKYTELSVK